MQNQKRLFTPSPPKNLPESPTLGGDTAVARREPFHLRPPPTSLPRMRQREREQSPTERLSERRASGAQPRKMSSGMSGNDDRKVSTASQASENGTTYDEMLAKYERDFAQFEHDKQQHLAEVQKCKAAAEGYGEDVEKTRDLLEELGGRHEQTMEGLWEMKGRYFLLQEQMEQLQKQIAKVEERGDVLTKQSHAEVDEMERLDEKLREQSENAAQMQREAKARMEYLEKKKARLDARKEALGGMKETMLGEMHG